jgi:Bacterial Ig-like domain (group 3)
LSSNMHNFGVNLTAGTNYTVVVNDVAGDPPLSPAAANTYTIPSCAFDCNAYPLPVALAHDVTVTATVPGDTANANVNNGSNDPGGGPITLAQFPAGPYPVGLNPVILTVTNKEGAFAQASATITVNAPTNTITTTANARVTFSPSAQVVTLTAMVIGGQGSLNTGSVTFTILAGQTVIGTAITGTVADDAATVHYMLPPGTGAGNYTVQAIYSDVGGTFAPSSDTTHILIVNKAATATRLSVSRATINPGQNVTVTALIVDPANAVPSGSVVFSDGATLLSTVTLNAGAASFSTSSLAPGVTHSLTAVYSGDANFFTSSSAVATVTVAPFSFTVTSLSGKAAVVRGGAAAYPMMLTPGSGKTFPNPVALSATGLPPGSTVTFHPATIPAGDGATAFTMMIQTGNPQAASSNRFSGASLAPMALAFLLLPMTDIKPIQKRLRKIPGLSVMLAAAALSLGAMVCLSGCGSNGFFDQAPRSYGVVVTATDTVTNAHTSANVTLTVQ